MKKKIYIPLVLISAFLIFGTVNAQKLEKTLDALLIDQYPAGEPGAAVLIAKKGEVIYRNASGMASLELDVPLTPDNVFEIGSITKQFTAVSILMLLEEGKLSLEDDIKKYYPDYPTHGHTITIHHLLTHTSGIKSYTSIPGWMAEARNDATPEELIDRFKNQPMDFAPGEQFLYNNSAYFLLGPIIAKASGLSSYEEFITKRIFEPLGMQNSYYGSKSRIIHNRAAGYQRDGDQFSNAEYLSMTLPGAAGGIMSTVDDMFRWMEAVRTNTLVKAETIQKAFTNYTLNNGEKINYGYGWMFNDINGSPTIEHGGGIFGYTTDGLWLPEEEVYAIVLTNRDDKSPGSLSTLMAATVIGKPFPTKDQTIDLPEEVMASYTGVYEFEDGSVRYITLDEGKLYSQRQGSFIIEIFPLTGTKFIYDNSLANIEFITNADGKMTAHFENRMEKANGVRTGENVPERKEVTVDAAVMQTYVGDYEIQPGFILTVTLEDGQLMTQATGQEKFPVFPESETKFFLKVVDAQIEFLKNDAGVVDALMLYQGGGEIRAAKVR